MPNFGLLDPLLNVGSGLHLILDRPFEPFLPLINISLLVNQLIRLIFQLLQLSICFRFHLKSALSLLVILSLQLCLLLAIPLDLLLTQLNFSLPPYFTKLIKLVDLRILHLDNTVAARSLGVFFLRTLAATRTRTHPAVVLACQKPEFFVAQLAVLLVLWWADLSSLSLNQWVQCINDHSTLKLLLGFTTVSGIHEVGNTGGYFVCDLVQEA